MIECWIKLKYYFYIIFAAYLFMHTTQTSNVSTLNWSPLCDISRCDLNYQFLWYFRVSYQNECCVVIRHTCPMPFSCLYSSELVHIYWNNHIIFSVSANKVMLGLCVKVSASKPNHFKHDDVIKWNNFRDTGHLCGEFTGHRWIPRTKASDVELWCFLWSTPE